MKKYTLFLFGFLLKIACFSQEDYGKTLNIGLGLGYYGYSAYSVGVISANYELDVARNFTIAPFISYGYFQNNYYWGDQQNPYRNYWYRETVIPFGAKGFYYFDELLHINNPKWDVYGALSLGYIYRNIVWENGYYGNTALGSNSIMLDLHAGVEYHLSAKAGLFLDLSTSASMVGIAFHH